MTVGFAAGLRRSWIISIESIDGVLDKQYPIADLEQFGHAVNAVLDAVANWRLSRLTKIEAHEKHRRQQGQIFAPLADAIGKKGV